MRREGINQCDKMISKVPVKKSYEFKTIKDGIIIFGDLRDQGLFCNIHVFDVHSGEEKWNLGLPTLWNWPLTDEGYKEYKVNKTLYVQASDSLGEKFGISNFLLGYNVNTGEFKSYYKTEGSLGSFLQVSSDEVCFWTRYGEKRDITYTLRYIANQFLRR